MFGNGVLADDGAKVRSLGWALVLNDCVLIKRGPGHRHTRGERYERVKAEMG